MRTLAWACGGFSAAIFAAVYLMTDKTALCAALICAALFTLLFILRRMRRVRLLSAAAAVGFAIFSVHAGMTTVKAARISGQTLELTAEAASFPEAYDDYTLLTVKLTSDNAPPLKTLLYVNDDSADALRPGQSISFTAKLNDASVRYGEDYQYYNSRDIYLTASAKTAITRTGEKVNTINHLPAYIGRAISKSVDRVFPADTRHYIKSLMINDRSELYDDTELYTAMKRTGIMHIVAVSGMHAAFVVGLMQAIFGAGRKSAVLCIIVVWLFALSAGAPPSAIRAAIMQTLLILSMHIRRENDAPTSLLAALALLLLINPYSAASVSLQLTFAAMAGLILFSGRISAYLMPYAQSVQNRILRTLAEYAAGVVASSLSVLVFTVPLDAIHFGCVSVISPLTNLTVLWIASFTFCGGYISAVAGMIFAPLGRALAWVVSWAARYTILVIKLLGRLPFSVVYTDDILGIAWLVCVYLLIAVAVISEGGVLKRTLRTVLACAATFAVMLFAVSIKYTRGADGYISVLDVGQGQCIAVISGDETLVIDCGGQGTFSNAGETAGAFLNSRRRKQIDALVLTHLHADHANGVVMLMEEVEVKKLILPADASDDDGLLDEIISAADRHGTQIEYISSDRLEAVGDIELDIYAPHGVGDANERGILMTVSIGEYDMLVTGDASKSVENRLMQEHELSDIELLIVGHHGSRYSSGGEFLQTVSADTAIISVGYNTYGHPTYEVLERLAACGYNIYRTDLNGTVTIEVK